MNIDDCEFGPCARLAVDLVDAHNVADLASQNKGTGQVMFFPVADAINKELTIGHGLVCVFFGSYDACERVLNVVREAGEIDE